VRILVTGARGQVGWELARAFQPLGEVVALDRSGADLSDPQGLRRLVRELQPALILNAAAYTAVDKAEDDEALATRVNAEAPGVLAEEARRIDALMVHYSTDYVWDGSATRPYLETDPTAPVNAYGRSKLAGEQAIAAAGGRWLVFRTSWVHAGRGGNFPRTMLRLAAERESLKVVDDQFGAPTGARLIADTSAQAVARAMAETAAGGFEPGVFNLVAGGSTSWHGLACAVIEGARRRGMPIRVREVGGIPAAQYPTRARRPANSRMSTAKLAARFGITLPPWERGVELLLDDLAEMAPRPG
jgi:dTDP-4-dehydrorhamnose reductase